MEQGGSVESGAPSEALLRLRAALGEAVHLQRRVHAHQLREFRPIVERQIAPGAHADLQHAFCAGDYRAFDYRA